MTPNPDPLSTPQSPTPDAETLAFFQAVFELVRAGDAEQLAPLLAKGLPANVRNHKGDSLLMLASYHGHLEAARQLLIAGADPELANDQGQTPLVGAAYKGDSEMVKLLLAHGADTETSGPAGKTALIMAAMFNRFEIIDLLLVSGADLQVRDVDGLSVVDAAKLMGAHQAAARLEEMLAQTHPAQPS